MKSPHWRAFGIYSRAACRFEVSSGWNRGGGTIDCPGGKPTCSRSKMPPVQIVGIAPWYIARSPIAGRVVQFMGSGEACSEYQTVLTRPGSEREIAAALSQWLSTDGAGDWDLLLLSRGAGIRSSGVGIGAGICPPRTPDSPAAGNAVLAVRVAGDVGRVLAATIEIATGTSAAIDAEVFRHGASSNPLGFDRSRIGQGLRDVRRHASAPPPKPGTAGLLCVAAIRRVSPRSQSPPVGRGQATFAVDGIGWPARRRRIRLH